MLNEKFPDQIKIFHHLTANELDETIRQGTYEAILKDQYHEFVDLCNQIITDPTVDNISCRFDNESLKFNIIYKE